MNPKHLPRAIVSLLSLSILPQEALSMQIFVHSASEDKTTTIEVEASDSIVNVKAKAYDKEAYQIDLQRLFFSSTELDDDRTLSDYAIGKESTLEVVAGVNSRNLTSALGWDPHGSFNAYAADADSSAGTGWTLLDTTGTLTITADAANPFTINLVSANGLFFGDMANFDPAQNAKWTILNADGGINGYSAGSKRLDTDGFTNAFSGDFSLDVQADTIAIVYSTVPEPATLATLAGLGALGLALRRRRKSR